MILYEMMTGLPPWYTTDRSKLFRRLRSAPLIFPNEVQFSPHCKACIAGLLERDPRLRLGVLGLRSAMRHEFFYRRINFEALRGCQIAAPIRPCEGWRQFANKNSSVEGSDSASSSFRGHSAGPSFESAAMGQITMELLDVATENFDDTFRRMPIETEDYEKQQLAAGHSPITEKELNEQTFRGFTFDGDELVGDEEQRAQWQRQQEHHNTQIQPQPLYQHQKLPQQQQISQQQNVQQQQQNSHSHVPNDPGGRGEMT
jgi:serine/threonine protein kinase